MLDPTFQRKMNLLALVAMLLLLALPTAGRVLAGAGVSRTSDGVWAQMCTMAGLKLVKIAPDANPLDSSPTPKPAPDGGAMADHDCAYCPLLGAMVALALWGVFVFPRDSGRSPVWHRPSAPRTLRHPSGLGSRGPPITL